MKQKSSARLHRLPGISDPCDEKEQEDVGEELPTLALPEPAPGTPSSLPRPRTRSVGPGIFVGWSRSISGSCSSIESGSGSPAISSSIKAREMEKDVATALRGDNEFLRTPCHSRHSSSTNSGGVKRDSPMRSSPSSSGGGSGNVGDASVLGTPSRNRREKLDAWVCSAGETAGTGSSGAGSSGVNISGASRAGAGAGSCGSAGGSVAVPSRSRRLSATSSREASNESLMGGDSRLSPRRAWLPGVVAGIVAVGNSSNKAAVLSVSKSTSSTEVNACAGPSSDSIDRHVRAQSPARHSSALQSSARQSSVKSAAGKGRGEVSGGMRDSSRLRMVTSANVGKDKRQSGSTGTGVKANTGTSRSSFVRGNSTGGVGRRRQPSYARGSPDSAPPLRRRGSRKGLVGSGGGPGGGRNAVPSRKALSPWRSPHVLRSPPRRGLVESGVRGGVGGGFRGRRATLSSSPMSPLSLKALHRTSSTSVLPALLGSGSLGDVAGGQTEVLPGREAAAAILSEERERVNRRLARFGDMADFAADTVRAFFCPRLI